MILPFIITLGAGLSTVIGFLFSYINIKEKYKNKFIVFCLSLSLTIMLMISITELLPNSILYISMNYNFFKSVFLIVSSLGLSVFFVNYIIKLSDKISFNSLYKLGILNTLILILHNIPEGMITYISTYTDMELGIKLVLSIILHNIPEGLAISIPIYFSTKKRGVAFLLTFISGLSEFVGALIIFVIFDNYIPFSVINIILLIVGGIMISLVINKIYPEVYSYNESKILSIGICIGLLLIIILNIII